MSGLAADVSKRSHSSSASARPWQRPSGISVGHFSMPPARHLACGLFLIWRNKTAPFVEHLFESRYFLTKEG
jgi:hypothetical protein